MTVCVCVCVRVLCVWVYCGVVVMIFCVHAHVCVCVCAHAVYMCVVNAHTLILTCIHPSMSSPGCACNEACTVVIRGATQQILDEADRSLHDALCVLSQTVKETRTVYGGGESREGL